MEPLFFEQAIDSHTSFYDDTEENFAFPNQDAQFPGYDINPVYSPAQPMLKKNHSVVPFELEPEPQFKRKAVPFTSIKQKKVCIEQSTYEETSNIPSTASNSDHELECSELDQPFGDLDLLVHSIGREQLKIPHIPTAQEISDLWNNMAPPYTPCESQDAYLSQFLKKDQLMKIKFALDEEIVNGTETQCFQAWVEGICQKDNAKLIKEMARRQKVHRYLEKKHGRTYSKKVHYQIRQRVAEERLRVKGRFVTWSQALDMLHETNKKQYNVNDYYSIKKKLKERFGSCKVKL